mmetsp:Transcript_5995/g.5401  ORF Transcript_5995/g.5401 Transcript_5995/m.5401 type:complete len:118 (+) Transcript_5995:153-506(+)
MADKKMRAHTTNHYESPIPKKRKHAFPSNYLKSSQEKMEPYQGFPSPLEGMNSWMKKAEMSGEKWEVRRNGELAANHQHSGLQANCISSQSLATSKASKQGNQIKTFSPNKGLTKYP